MSGAQRGWWGRVFGQGVCGGNHTVIVWPADGVDLAACAKTLAVPDSGFVVHDDGTEVVLRTFSPFEELAQCLQTSLAVASARATTPTSDAPLRVRHERSRPLSVHCEGTVTGTVTWAGEEGDTTSEVEPVRLPESLDGALPASRTCVVLRQARSRLHVQLPGVEEVEAANLTRDAVLAACSETRTHGVVLSAPSGEHAQRVRVFTTSLGGAEDSATGGAVLGVARLLAADGRCGDIAVRQGPPGDPAGQGFLRVRISERGVLVGGQVTPLMVGRMPAW